jgi:hypothetical protein
MALRTVSLRVASDLRKVGALGPRRWADLVRAAGELALAHYRLATRSTQELIATPATAPNAAELSEDQRRLVERVGFAIVRVGPRVPWRADCLVQALAARRWLARAGIPSALHIGARNDGLFAAHAWLTVGERVVTGGPVDGYVPLLDPRRSAALSTNQR